MDPPVALSFLLIDMPWTVLDPFRHESSVMGLCGDHDIYLFFGIKVSLKIFPRCSV